MSLIFAPSVSDDLIPAVVSPAADEGSATIVAARNLLVENRHASQAFSEVSRKLTAGPLTLEYLVAYQIELFSQRAQK